MTDVTVLQVSAYLYNVKLFHQILFSFRRQTMLLKLDTEGVADKLSFQPGDHVALYPANNPTLVDEFIGKLVNVPDVNTVYQLQIMQEIATGKLVLWWDYGNLCRKLMYGY